MANAHQLIIGSRGSPLALYQARLVQAELGKVLGITGKLDDRIPVRIYTTSGDRLQSGRLLEFGGKGLFTKELETALQSGDIDMAVHSMKDVPTHGQDGLCIAAILPRADVRDAFISPRAKTLLDLPTGAVIGTASIRRQAQALCIRPDLNFTILRGNVGTRLAKLEDGECAATFLAAAGLHRLDMGHVITQHMDIDAMLPAPAQGAIGIEIRKDCAKCSAVIPKLNHSPTQIAITAERAFLSALDGSCRTPIAAYARLQGSELHFRGQAFTSDGKTAFARETKITLSNAPIKDSFAAGYALGLEIKAEAGGQLTRPGDL